VGEYSRVLKGFYWIVILSPTATTHFRSAAFVVGVKRALNPTVGSGLKESRKI